MTESVEVRLARIEEKQDQCLEKLDDQLKGQHDLEKRVESLEKWRAFLVGAWAVVSIVAGLIWSSLHK